MQRISSNTTLFFRLFVPTFWAVFYGLFTVVLFLADNSTVNIFQSDWLKYSNLIFYLSSLLILYLTVFQLKRVELSEEGIFVTDYFKTVKYTYDSVESISYKKYPGFKLGNLRLREKGFFGTNISFILKKGYLEEYIQKNPEPFGYMDLYL